MKNARKIYYHGRIVKGILKDSLELSKAITLNTRKRQLVINSVVVLVTHMLLNYKLASNLAKLMQYGVVANFSFESSEIESEYISKINQLKIHEN